MRCPQRLQIGLRQSFEIPPVFTFAQLPGESKEARITLTGLPDSPGVYLFHDRDGVVLYVGKAKSLRPRVRSYFQQSSSDTRATIQQLPERVADIVNRPAANEVTDLTTAPTRHARGAISDQRRSTSSRKGSSWKQ